MGSPYGGPQKNEDHNLLEFMSGLPVFLEAIGSTLAVSREQRFLEGLRVQG